MSEAKFTKGEWAILPEEVDKDYIRIRGTVLGGKYKVANVCSLKGDYSVDEARANARLIKAAPIMFQELADLRNEFNCECGHPRCSREETQRGIDALLAEIRGES